MHDSGYFQQVFEVVRRIPEGRVTTYGAIAAYLGGKGGARMVGWAMNAASKTADVPAHRVVNRKGVLTGKHHFPGTFVMQQLLEEEGIKVKDDQVLDFKNRFWDPSAALDPIE